MAENGAGCSAVGSPHPGGSLLRSLHMELMPAFPGGWQIPTPAFLIAPLPPRSKCQEGPTLPLRNLHCTARALLALAPWEAPICEGSSSWLPNTPHVRPNEHSDRRIEDKHPNEPELSCNRSCRMRTGTPRDTSCMGSSHTIPEQGWCYARGYYTQRRVIL